MKTIIFTEKAPKPIGPYSQGILCGNLLFVSGQIAIQPETGKLIEGDIEAQTHQVISNILEILKSAGLSLKNVIKSTLILTDIKDFPVVNQIYAGYFTEDPPAREILQSVALPLNAKIEISVIAEIK